MFKKLFRTNPASVPNDVSAIVGAFDRLSNRRLNLIGLNRETLFDSVGDMMVHAEEERAIVREIIAIIDASTDTSLKSPDIPLPVEYSKQTEAVAAAKTYT
jgi:hypothetical protein